MQEVIHCPSCQRKLQVPESLLGQDVQCPTCGATFVASWGGQGAAPPAPPPPRPYNPPPPSAPPPPYGAPQPPYGGPPPPPPYGAPPQPPYQRGNYAPNDYADYDDYNDQPRRSRSRRGLTPHRGSTVLTLGILSLVLGGFGIILGPIAWILGNQDLAEIRAGRMDPEGESSTNAGRVCGMIATIFYVAIIVLFCTCMIPAMMNPQGFR